MPVRQQHQPLRLPGLLVGGQGQVGGRHRVVFGHQQHQRRGADAFDVAARFVLAGPLAGAQGHAVLPVRRQGGAGAVEGAGIGTGVEAGRVAFADHPAVAGRLPLVAGQAVGLEGLPRGMQARPRAPQEALVAADGRHLGDHAAHPPVQRAEHDGVAAAVAGTPDTQAAGVHFRAQAGPGEHLAQVVHLLPRVDVLARFPTTGTEAPVVAEHHGKAGLGEVTGEGIQVQRLERGEAGAHQQQWEGGRGIRQVVPGVQFDSVDRDAQAVAVDSGHGRAPRGRGSQGRAGGGGWPSVIGQLPALISQPRCARPSAACPSAGETHW